MLETEYEDITYKSEFSLATLPSKIYCILQWNMLSFNYETDIKKISDNLSLYDLKLWNYLLESEDENYLNSLKENLEWKWTKIKWEFENKWNFYLILEKPKIDWEIEIGLGETNWKVIDIMD
jgi:hypothetical protein